MREIQMKSLDAPDTGNIEFRLRTERKELLDRVSRQLHGSDDPRQMAFANQLAHIDDWAAADLQDAIDIALLGHEFLRLRDIDAALRRMADGDYGICNG